MRISLAGLALPFVIAGGVGIAPVAAVAAPSGQATVMGAGQTISFTGPADQQLSATPPTLSATATSGLSVVFTSNTTGVCTVSGSTFTPVSVGMCTIAANQTGDIIYDAAPEVTQSFNITKNSQTISFTAPVAHQLSAMPKPTLTGTTTKSLPVTFTSNTTGVCTVSGTTVTPVAVGTCMIAADQLGDATTNAATTVTDSFSITQDAQTITWTPTGTRAIASVNATLAATATSALTVAFTSATPSVCTVAGTTVTFVTGGTCTVHANQAGNAGYAAAPQADDTFTITKTAQVITFAALPGAPMSNTPSTLTGTSDSSLTVAFISATPSVCTVSGTSLTLLGVGTCTVDADQPGNGTYAAATQVARSFTVTSGPQTVTFAQPADRAYNAAPLSVSPTASSGLTVALTSATLSVCTVSGTTITTVAGGTCTIHANQPGDADWAAATQVSRSYLITPAAQTISFTPPASTALSASPVTVSATATSGLTVAFSSTTSGVCTVSGTSVTLLTTGTCTISAAQAGDANWMAATAVPGSFTVAANSQTITFGALTSTAFDAGTKAVSATASSSLPVAFTSATTSVCTVSGGTVTLLQTGTCTINADQAGDTSFAAAPQVTQSFTITVGAQSITFTAPADRAFDAAPLTVAPTASSTLIVALTSATTPVCTVSGVVITTVAVGTCTIDANQAGDGNWVAATQVSRSFTITKAAQTITFSAPATTVVSGGPLTLTATSPSGLTVTFAGTTNPVCTVSGTSVTLVAVGTCSLTADQAGNANYDAATQATASFTVIQDPVPVTLPTDAAPATAGDLANATGPTAEPGGTVTLSGTGYKANTTITLAVYSTPVTLGTTTTNGAGAFSVVVTIPSGLDVGGHTLVAAGLAPDNTLRYLSVPVVVATPAGSGSSGGLAVTGAATRVLGALGAWAVIIGTMLTLLGSRRSWFPLLRDAYRGRHIC